MPMVVTNDVNKLRTLGSRYPNSDTEAFRYPNRVGGLGIRTKQGSRYPNKTNSDSLSEQILAELFGYRGSVFGYRDPWDLKVAKKSKMALSQLLS